MQKAERQIGSGQDYAACGEVDNMCYAFVADGHGSARCIEYIRSIDPDLIASEPDPCAYLFDMVRALGDTRLSGFTFTFVRVFKNEASKKIQVWNVGDSETHVFINGSLDYKTPPHDFLNDAEVERTKDLVEHVHQSKAPFPVSADRVELVLSPTGYFKNDEKLTLSMAFGHNNATGFEPSLWEREVSLSDEVRAVCGSDGFFNMLVDDLSKDADELADEAAGRWQKKWEFFDGEKTVTTSYGSDFDDVAVAVLMC